MADLGSFLFRAAGYKIDRVATRAGSVRVFEAAGRHETLPTIALVHGLSADAVGYLPLLQKLRRHARVVAIDLPAHGGSEGDGITLTECVAGGVEALSKYLHEPAIIFGNSLGGLTSARFALEYPHFVRGLFLASPAGAPSSLAEIEELLAKFRIETPEDAMRFIEIILYAKPGPIRHLLARDLVARHKTSRLKALIRDVPNAKPFTPEELAPLSKIPTYFLWGRNERLLPASHLEFWKKNLPHATFDEPWGFGHSPQLDSPTDVARRIIAFAREH